MRSVNQRAVSLGGRLVPRPSACSKHGYMLERLVSETITLERINEAFGQGGWSGGKGQVGRLGISLTPSQVRAPRP